ncbi:hypothetical protein [uncultured Microscilla sp.]|uniref:hypothetical protein n=1 Tax=uncultured Microscilla sp. TaxID=432653 RepID=UPI002611F02F|nr:hypothetical protein [uncultured Microscilla sp.]
MLTGDSILEMDGVINSNSLDNFKQLITKYPHINQINIKECKGSSNDIINLQLAALVHQKKINIHLMDNGLIASRVSSQSSKRLKLRLENSGKTNDLL